MWCPSLLGCVSEGKTREEALVNVRDAIQGYLASLKKHNEPIPPSIEEETVEVGAQAATSLWHGCREDLGKDWIRN